MTGGLSFPPMPSIERKARKKKAKVAPPEPPAKVSVKTAVCYVAVFVKGVSQERWRIMKSKLYLILKLSLDDLNRGTAKFLCQRVNLVEL